MCTVGRSQDVEVDSMAEGSRCGGAGWRKGGILLMCFFDFYAYLGSFNLSSSHVLL